MRIGEKVQVHLSGDRHFGHYGSVKRFDLRLVIVEFTFPCRTCEHGYLPGDLIQLDNQGEKTAAVTYILKHRPNEYAERLGVSHSGNPYFRVTFNDGTSYQTARDAQVNFQIDNLEMFGDVEILLNDKREITRIRPA